MAKKSVRLRLLIAAILAVGVALIASAYGLGVLFERHLERRALSELRTDIRALLAGMKIDDQGALELTRSPSDQRYHAAFSGLYWQISRGGTVVARSRSLWDEELAMPEDVLPGGQLHQHAIVGPRGRALLAIEEAVFVKRGSQDFLFRVTAALDHAEITSAAQDFRGDLILGLGGIGTALLAAFWVALDLGLAPLTRLRSALGKLRSGEKARLEGDYSSEVAPLVSDLNELLRRHETLIEKAKGRAGNLAHGLKTPLTAISVLADELEGRGEQHTARELVQHVSTMQRHVEHELALARSAQSHGLARAVKLHDFVDRLVRTMQRLPRGSELEWSNNIDPNVAVHVDEVTLGELIGNPLDNARKWAKRNIRISAQVTDGRVALSICDDGPGVPEAERLQILTRGRRLDATQPGSGLGLSIVADIMDELGGLVELQKSNAGGLNIRLTFPSRN